MLTLAAMLLCLFIQPTDLCAHEKGADNPTVGSRRETPLDAGWTFQRGDSDHAQAIDFDDTDWRRVTLPHSFNDGDGEQRDYYRGASWYRRAFVFDRAPNGRRLVVQFGAAALSADIYLNGSLVGTHKGGHAAFRVDLTSGLRPGRNLLAVRVDNSADPIITPLGGDFTVFGGLYRDVSLIEVDPIHIDLFDHGGPGVYLTLSKLSDRSAVVEARVRVANNSGAETAVPVTVRIRDRSGKIVAHGTAAVSVAAGGVAESVQAVTIPDPHRWDGVRDPYLYQAEVVLGQDGDRVTIPLGLREFRVDPAEGFILNGRPYQLYGVNLMHSARPGRGTAVGRDEIAEDFDLIGRMGATGVRLVHFQHPAAAYDEADRRGMVTWTEIGINSMISPDPAFQANAEEQMRELIAQNYNHPSIFFWGLGNEVYDTSEDVVATLQSLNKLAHAIDPSRPTAYAHCCQGDDAPKALVPDVVGYNRYFGWYPDQKGTLGNWAEKRHAADPSRPFMVSEYGAGASILHQADPPGTVVPASGWHPEQYQTLFHERSWLGLKDKRYLAGSFVWVMFDLASAGRNEGDRPGINDKGLVTYDRRTPKDAWYWYQANWSATPMLHLTSKRFDRRTEQQAEVKAYTNGGAAELFLNGRSMGRVAPVDHILRWQVALSVGENHLVVEQGRGSKLLRDEARWTLVPQAAIVALPVLP